MLMSNSQLRINQQRFRSDFEALSKIGATSTGGVDRPAFSGAHLQARDWFRKKILQSGFEFNLDGSPIILGYYDPVSLMPLPSCSVPIWILSQAAVFTTGL
jgi:hypothetical protein